MKEAASRIAEGRAALAQAAMRYEEERIRERILVSEGKLSMMAIAVATVAVALSSQVEWLFLGISWFTTWGHEMAHAIAGLLTAGNVLGISIIANGNGATDTRGGVPVVIAWVGYPGSLLWGAVLWRLANRERLWLLMSIAIGVVITALFWAHDQMTFTVLLAIIGLAGAPRLLPWKILGSVWMRFLGAVVFTFSWWRIIALIVLPDKGDAGILKSFTDIAPEVWIGSWCVAGVLITMWLVQGELRELKAERSWNGRERRKMAAKPPGEISLSLNPKEEP